MSRVKRAIIMAAGKGERLNPVTLDTPKPLVKVNGVRMIDTIIDGLHANGVMSALKHFPGHGDTATDSHTGLPLIDKSKTDELCNLITPQKDVDGLGQNASFDSATATAILWLLSGYDIKLTNQKIAIVGRGKLVGMPLYKMFTNSNYDVTLFHRGDDLTNLKQYDIIITATGVPGLIVDSMIKPGAILVDAGTASEDGVLKGDLATEIRKRTDLSAITPTTGGVGPLTVTCLFDHVIQSHTDTNS